MRTASKDLAFLTLPILINAVSLADMAPRAENLPSNCNQIYTAPIAGCTDSDFQSGQCSHSCVHSLEALVTPIKMACGNDGITGQNLIVAFLADVGPAQICQNAPAMWTGGPTSGGPPMPTNFGSTSTSKMPKTTNTHKTTVTSGILTVSSIKSPKSSTLIVDTSKTPTTGALSEQTSTSGALPGQLNTGDHSGGGSPFDTAGNMGGAATLTFSATITILSAALALFTNFR